MNNTAIIANIAITENLFTQDQINRILETGKEIPLHTVQGWSVRGYMVKKGQHGIETRLWKKKAKTDKGTDNVDKQGKTSDFYLAKAFLFREDQVESKSEKR